MAVWHTGPSAVLTVTGVRWEPSVGDGRGMPRS